MPSSNSPRDDGESDSASSTENPFVRFRNVVDYHVGSVLQGIIGLPTILSRAPNSGNGRWAELEGHSHRNQDDPRRQIPQRDAAGNTSDEEVNIPIKKFHEQSPGGNDAFEPSDHDDDDYDLFSLFDDSFIERVKRSTKGHPWLELQPGDKLRWRYESPGLGVQQSIQQRFYASLVDAWKGDTEPPALPDKSVVPYLLFSSYSPLNLMDMPPLRPNDYSSRWDQDKFTYCEAFEDLLRESAGKPMRPNWPAVRYGAFPSLVMKASPADGGMMWMGVSLVDGNVLHEDPMPEQVDFDPLLGEIHTMTPSSMAIVLRNFTTSMIEYGLSHLDADTEQDMYERFFAPSSEPAGNSERISSTVHELLTMLQSEGRAIGDVFNDADPTERSQASEQPPSTTRHIKSSRVADIESPLEPTPATVPENERVVSSSTSTTQHTDEDGTVRTKIVIEKRFEDGRKSVTETSHIQSPSGEKQVWRDGYVEPGDGKHIRDSEKGETGKKKGWFWN